MKAYFISIIFFLSFTFNVQSKDKMPDKSVQESPKAILHVASRLGATEKLKYLIAKGWDVNARIGYDSTPLHWASVGGYDDITETLINYGADVNAREKSGVTPLHKALKLGHTNIAKILIENGADLHARDYHNGDTPLDIALDRGYTNIIKSLVKHKNFSFCKALFNTPKTMLRLYLN